VPAAAPPPLQRLLRSCLAPSPGDRPSFQEVYDQLAALTGSLEGEQAAASAAEGSQPLPVDDCFSCTESIMKQAAANPPPPQGHQSGS
jgi:hypothetical protein